jgi:hypothetical protein
VRVEWQAFCLHRGVVKVGNRCGAILHGATSDRRVTDFVRKWRLAQGRSASTKAFVPLAFEQGEALQFDWNEEGLVIAASTAASRSCA